MEEIIADTIIGGLPKPIQIQVKNGLADAKPTTEQVEKIMNNIHSEWKNQKEFQRYRTRHRWTYNRRGDESEEDEDVSEEDLFKRRKWETTEGNKRERRREDAWETQRNRVQCYSCHEFGHISINCPQKKVQGKHENQPERKKVV